MLKKCLKYEMKKMVKFLSIFFFLALFFSLLSRGISAIGDSFVITFLSAFMQGAAISMMFSILINCFMRIWAEIRTSFYLDQSYLTHTLPVEKKTLYFSKVISASVLVLISMLAVLICLAILFLKGNTIDFLKSVLEPVALYFDMKIWVMLTGLFVLIYLELMSGMASGFFGLVFGHTRLQHKILSSVVFGFLFYMAGEGVLVIVMFALGLMHPSFMEIFKTNDLFALNSDHAVLLVIISFVVYFLFAVFGFFLGYRIFKKGVNVD